MSPTEIPIHVSLFHLLLQFISLSNILYLIIKLLYLLRNIHEAVKNNRYVFML